MKTQNYTIIVNGCDAYTKFKMKLNKTELAIILKLANKCNKTSTHRCEPQMSVEGDGEVDLTKL